MQAAQIGNENEPLHKPGLNSPVTDHLELNVQLRRGRVAESNHEAHTET